jgi:hypothetical protein
LDDAAKRFVSRNKLAKWKRAGHFGSIFPFSLFGREMVNGLRSRNTGQDRVHVGAF